VNIFIFFVKLGVQKMRHRLRPRRWAEPMGVIYCSRVRRELHGDLL
jgi:hypothetical protein